MRHDPPVDRPSGAEGMFWDWYTNHSLAEANGGCWHKDHYGELYGVWCRLVVCGMSCDQITEDVLEPVIDAIRDNYGD